MSTGPDWQIGVWPAVWPKRLSSRAVRAASERHDRDYDGPRDRDSLLDYDLRWMAIHAREGGWIITGALAWLVLRAWAWHREETDL